METMVHEITITLQSPIECSLSAEELDEFQLLIKRILKGYICDDTEYAISCILVLDSILPS